MPKSQRKKWRLYQFLVACGVVKSKEQAASLAHNKKITVNGKIMQSLHFQIHPFKDDIKVNGEKIVLKENRGYFILNKPKGIETTKQNILPFIKNKVSASDLLSFSPVGRLDKDTTGLLIITNDGRIGKRILDPKTKRTKVYETKVKGILSEKELSALISGVIIEIEDKPYKTLPAIVKVLSEENNTATLTIAIYEGKKRQVRKMCEAVNHPVIELKRISIAKLLLENLKEGEVREYKKDEIYHLLFE